uniref:Uncharacterized protein n=1 Tax=Romanomermis culicivorax TaxID=13658 RepID=A0A915IM78_ROMCU
MYGRIEKFKAAEEQRSKNSLKNIDAATPFENAIAIFFIPLDCFDVAATTTQMDAVTTRRSVRFITNVAKTPVSQIAKRGRFFVVGQIRRLPSVVFSGDSGGDVFIGVVHDFIVVLNFALQKIDVIYDWLRLSRTLKFDWTAAMAVVMSRSMDAALEHPPHSQFWWLACCSMLHLHAVEAPRTQALATLHATPADDKATKRAVSL